jgi:hypothetical protein
MDESHVEAYGGYLLKCFPMPIGDGRGWVAQVWITPLSEPNARGVVITLPGQLAARDVARPRLAAPKAAPGWMRGARHWRNSCFLLKSAAIARAR